VPSSSTANVTVNVAVVCISSHHWVITTTVRNDLESRRRAISRALRGASRPVPAPQSDHQSGEQSDRQSDRHSEIATLHRAIESLAGRVDELGRAVEELRGRTVAPVLATIPVTPPPADGEPPASRVSVPPITPAKLSTQAFDVLLGTVDADVEAQSRIA
jgi:hypothetical protein